MVPSSSERRGHLTLFGPLERANLSHCGQFFLRDPTVVVVFLPAPEDGNRFSFRNVVLSSYLKSRTTDEDHKPGDSESSVFIYVYINIFM
jgi:hypothetical protein